MLYTTNHIRVQCIDEEPFSQTHSIKLVAGTCTDVDRRVISSFFNKTKQNVVARSKQKNIMYPHRQPLVGPELQGTWLQLQRALPAEILCQTFFNWPLKERNVGEYHNDKWSFGSFLQAKGQYEYWLSSTPFIGTASSHCTLTEHWSHCCMSVGIQKELTSGKYNCMCTTWLAK